MFYLHSLTATEARLSLFVNLVYYQKAEKQSFRKSSAGLAVLTESLCPLLHLPHTKKTTSSTKATFDTTEFYACCLL